VAPLAESAAKSMNQLKSEDIKEMAKFGREREQSELRQSVQRDVNQAVMTIGQG